MKLNIRLISLLLTLVMALSMLASCTPTSSDETTVDPEISTDTPESSDLSVDEARSSFDIIVNGNAEVKIIRPMNLSSGDIAVDAAVSIRNDIEKALGVRLKMGDDFKQASEKYDDSTVEILVGKTAHSQVTTAMEGLKYGDYTVKAIGNKIVIFGYTSEAIKQAVRTFVDIVEEHSSSESGTLNVSIPAEALNISDTYRGTEFLSDIPVYEDGTFSATSTSDLECDQVIIEDATVESYNAYIAKLESEGFKKYTDNDINGNLFTTLYNSEYTLNVGYYKPYEECRIIMEPYSDKTLIGLESDNKYTAVTTSQITMFGCEFVDSTGANKGNGLSLLYRLADGSFVIVDGGHDTNSSSWRSNLVNAITEQAKEYASGKDIRIAAWFISHAHGDHMGMLRKEAETFGKKFTVERVIGCFMSDEEVNRSLASSSGPNFSGGEAKIDNYVRTAARTMGADMVVCHTGQRFYFADTVFEILYTVENFAPTPANALNTSSILVRSITTDAAGNKTDVMVTGDCTGPALAICNKLYGDNMRCQVVQVAHHGYQTWGNDAAVATAYKYMSPEIVLWPQGAKAFPKYKELSYSKVLWDGTNKNFQQLYVAGWNNTQHTVPLPYNGDVNTIVSKITVQP